MKRVLYDCIGIVCMDACLFVRTETKKPNSSVFNSSIVGKFPRLCRNQSKRSLSLSHSPSLVCVHTSFWKKILQRVHTFIWWIFPISINFLLPFLCSSFACELCHGRMQCRHMHTHTPWLWFDATDYSTRLINGEMMWHYMVDIYIRWPFINWQRPVLMVDTVHALHGTSISITISKISCDKLSHTYRFGLNWTNKLKTTKTKEKEKSWQNERAKQISKNAMAFGVSSHHVSNWDVQSVRHDNSHHYAVALTQMTKRTCVSARARALGRSLAQCVYIRNYIGAPSDEKLDFN